MFVCFSILVPNFYDNRKFTLKNVSEGGFSKLLERFESYILIILVVFPTGMWKYCLVKLWTVLFCNSINFLCIASMCWFGFVIKTVWMIWGCFIYLLLNSADTGYWVCLAKTVVWNSVTVLATPAPSCCKKLTLSWAKPGHPCSHEGP